MVAQSPEPGAHDKMTKKGDISLHPGNADSRYYLLIKDAK